MIARTLAAFTALLIFSADANAHGGGLDSRGCHHNRKAGGYHCHRGDLAGQSFVSKDEALRSAASAPATELTLDQKQVPYSRKLYRHWIDADNDCQDTRQEVLIEESLESVRLDDKGCRVQFGRWYDLYTGETFTDPKKLDIDHLVPLAEVHRSGGHSWSAEKREAYANDLTGPVTLIAVKASENRSKGDKDPALWLPSNEAYHCEYVATWEAVKRKWGLVMDVAEGKIVSATIHKCESDLGVNK